MPNRQPSFSEAGAVTASGVLTCIVLVAGVTTAAAAAVAMWLAFCGIQCVQEAPAPGGERCGRHRLVLFPASTRAFPFTRSAYSVRARRCGEGAEAERSPRHVHHATAIGGMGGRAARGWEAAGC